MSEIRTAIPFPCHIYDIKDNERLYRSIHVQMIKSYGKDVSLEDGTVLHGNCSKGERENGSRSLVRCCVCGALFVDQQYVEYDMYDGPDSMEHLIPVGSEEEADLLNILLDEGQMYRYPVRHIRRRNWRFGWTEGPDPCAGDPEELKRIIREKYSHADQKLLENLLREAGKAHAVEKTPMAEPDSGEENENTEKRYQYLVNHAVNPPSLIRLGPIEKMEAGRFEYPGVWKDTPHLNDIRVGLGSCMDYDDVTEEEAMEIMKRNQEKFDRMAAERK